MKKNNRFPLFYIIIFLIFLSCSSTEESPGSKDNLYKLTWTSFKKHTTPEWFKDAKFGIYCHWGVYSVPTIGTEWISRNMYVKERKERRKMINKYGKNVQYDDFIPMFKANHFNAERWAALFKKSGAKFAGPVAEHTDNFSMWDSKVNPWNAARMGPKRDIVGELAKAIKTEGLKFVTTFHHQWNWAWYPTWNGLVDTSTAELREFYGETTTPVTFDSVGGNPSQYGPSQKFVKKWKTKVFEVVDQYKPDMIWFDSRLNTIPEKARQLMLAHYYNKAKEWDKPVVFTYKHNDVPPGVGVLDIERGRLAKKVNYFWLTDDSWDWTTWDYQPDAQYYKDANQIVDELVDIVSKNGCLLLDIGPKADGTIPEKVKSGLLDVGKWLHKYGKAIYKTRPFVTFGEGPTKLKKNRLGGVNDKGIAYTSKDFRFTTNRDTLYIIQLGVPHPKKQFTLKSFAKDSVAGKVRFKSLDLVGSSQKLYWNKKKDGLHLTAPSEVPNNIALVYKAIIKSD